MYLISVPGLSVWGPSASWGGMGQAHVPRKVVRHQVGVTVWPWEGCCVGKPENGLRTCQDGPASSGHPGGSLGVGRGHHWMEPADKATPVPSRPPWPRAASPSSTALAC